MHHIQPKNRHQMEFTSLEDVIENDNAVRFIDAFVDKLELTKLGFTLNTLKQEGRPSYESSVFSLLDKFCSSYCSIFIKNCQ